MQKSNGKLWETIANGEIEIRSLTEADLEGALNVLDKGFFVDEPVCIANEINLPENTLARKELRELSRMTASDGVSLVAKSTSSGEVAAVAFNKIQYIPPDGEEPFFVEFLNKHTNSPQARSLMNFMIDADARINIYELYKVDCFCELMFLATSPTWRYKGIGRSLVKYTIEQTRNLSQGIGLENIHESLRSKRPSGVTALFSSIGSQALGEWAGFKVLNTVLYTDYKFNGKTFAQRIPPIPKGCQQVVKMV